MLLNNTLPVLVSSIIG